ncbi:MAG: hypothetical protein H8E34_02880 [Bacteroidetes bacterium]|nr:hypothetical protein [Bacteroidota bacterium]MBL6943885.1 hypothetical protein [Bacteroidales bacterium]
MITKLTLTIEEETIKRAKKFAKESGKSLSALVETYFKLLTKTKGVEENDKLTEKVNSLYGSVTVPDNFDYKAELEKAINEKHNV